MIAMTGDWPDGLDPYKLDSDLRAIITSHGGSYLDILPDFRALSNPQMGYMAIDGHPGSAAHAQIASFLTGKLAPEVISAEKTVPRPQAGWGPESRAADGAGS